jgi:hypothetical protein
MTSRMRPEMIHAHKGACLGQDHRQPDVPQPGGFPGWTERNPMSRVYPVVTVLAVVVSSGVIHGVWTNRWTTPAVLEQAVARMDDLPMTLGDWDGQLGELDERQVAVADVSGCVHRRYVNRRTGDVVVVLLSCGRPGPLSVHTPEVCYRGAGYDQVGVRVKHPGPAETGEFWVCRFQKQRSSVSEHLRVFYAWNATGKWEPSESPRGTFARFPALYKLYVIRQLPREDEALEEDPSVEFLRALLPALQKALFPAPGVGSAPWTTRRTAHDGYSQHLLLQGT